jgi:hypothetical protein
MEMEMGMGMMGMMAWNGHGLERHGPGTKADADAGADVLTNLSSLKRPLAKYSKVTGTLTPSPSSFLFCFTSDKTSLRWWANLRWVVPSSATLSDSI